ncbi:MAG: M18 family aminopeptidase [Clostridia bacterium]|nr:M18 family aminopeptidase [Clostridia bacterium]
MSVKNYSNGLFEFIKKSPTAYHAVATVRDSLLGNGYTELAEGDAWSLENGKGYFTVKNGTSLIAFRYNDSAVGFSIVASHGDSPSFKVKPSGASACGAYTRIATERYGGMIMYSWLDRPLSIAGRVVTRSADGIKSRLLNVDRDLLVIPSIAIHMNRRVNDGFAPNPAQDMIPLFSASGEEIKLNALIASELGINEGDIISHDLFLYVREEGRVLGAKDELMLCPRLDDLACVYSSLEGFLSGGNADMIPALAVFDNEEVGSDTKQGAASTFFYDTLSRIIPDNEKYLRALSNSFMISADNAHAKHPNHPELSDSENAPVVNGGIAIKYNANQKYATDGISAGVFTRICELAGVSTQSYCNRADMPGGSTLGSIANTKVSVFTVDIGMPQLAMHSAVETAGVRDLEALILALSRFYSASISVKSDEIKIK